MKFILEHDAMKQPERDTMGGKNGRKNRRNVKTS